MMAYYGVSFAMTETFNDIQDYWKYVSSMPSVIFQRLNFINRINIVVWTLVDLL